MTEESSKPLLLYKDGKVSYGSDSSSKGKRVIFCVHGNPSQSCCTTVDGADSPEGRNGSIISEAESEYYLPLGSAAVVVHGNPSQSCCTTVDGADSPEGRNGSIISEAESEYYLPLGSAAVVVHGNPSQSCCTTVDGADSPEGRNGSIISEAESEYYLPLGSAAVVVHGNPSQSCCTTVDGADSPEGRNGSIISEAERHCHKQRNEEVDKRARRKLIIASVLCVVFMIGEIVGGVLSNSLAIATDAAHLLTDFASFMISLFALWVANRPATRRMPFGWYRAEVIGALTSVLLIWVVTGILVYMAVQRVIYRNFEIEAVAMLITSGIGVLVNLM
ncbi:cation efflux family domain-containing protein [Phthorimaea operculella]|nr:cation efflux family domain-containing protein [Phthorimaea operculella]